MDPNANRLEALNLARAILRAHDADDGDCIDAEDAARLAELLIALDAWIRRGGALPDMWRH